MRTRSKARRYDTKQHPSRRQKGGKNCKGGSSKGSKGKEQVAGATPSSKDKGKGHGNSQGVKRAATSDSMDSMDNNVRRRCSFGSTSGAFQCYYFTYKNQFSSPIIATLHHCRRQHLHVTILEARATGDS